MTINPDKTFVAMNGKEFCCGRCGSSMLIHLPIPVDQWAEIARRWIALHQLCQEAPTAEEKRIIDAAWASVQKGKTP